MQYIDLLGFVAGCLTSVSTLPQLIKTIREKQADEISLGMFAVLTSGLCLWIWYGIEKNDFPIIITNIIAVILNCLRMVLKWKYGKPSKV